MDGEREGPGAIPVVAAVICREGRYLVCRRPASKRHGGLWEFPGGKLAAGEGLADAVRRELYEELAIGPTRVGAVLYRGRDPGSRYEIHFMTVEVSDEPTALEHDGIAWLTAGELGSVPLAPADGSFVRDHLTRASGDEPSGPG